LSTEEAFAPLGRAGRDVVSSHSHRWGLRYATCPYLGSTALAKLTVKRVWDHPSGWSKPCVYIAMPFSCMFNLGKTLLAGLSIIQSTTNESLILLTYSNEIENYHSVESEKVSKSAEGQFAGKIWRGDSRFTSEGGEGRAGVARQTPSRNAAHKEGLQVGY